MGGFNSSSPGGASRIQKEPGGDRKSWEKPGGAQKSQEDPGGARNNFFGTWRGLVLYSSLLMGCFDLHGSDYCNLPASGCTLPSFTFATQSSGMADCVELLSTCAGANDFMPRSKPERKDDDDEAASRLGGAPPSYHRRMVRHTPIA